MTVRLLFFSVLRDLSGTAELDFTCQRVDQVSGLLTHVYQRWPALAEWDKSLLIAVDECYANRDTELKDGAVVALMPPVQGG